MRKKLLAYNTVSALALQVVSIISGFILPRLILGHYGSEINGLVGSITQFLGIISFLELGVGAVVRSSLYKPLARGDMVEVSQIMRSGQRFFRKIALILLVYALILTLTYPRLIGYRFDPLFTALLILSMSVNAFTQYYFGVIERILLVADQRGYIQSVSQIFILTLNLAVCALVINLNGSILTVKAISSILFLLSPLFLRLYVNRHYSLQQNAAYGGEPIQQKWNGIAQHIANVVLNDTDTVILTAFSSLSVVSVYSVYRLVTQALKYLFDALTSGIYPLVGELWAKQERERLKDTFDFMEWVIHAGVTFIFGCAGFLIVSFVCVYTKGISDTDYAQPLFGALLVAAYACYCLCAPYQALIFAAGHYRQTQRYFIIAALLNVVISASVVKVYGLVGVAVGTLAAMLYQVVWMAHYNEKKFLIGSFRGFLRCCLTDIAAILLYLPVLSFIPVRADSYGTWIVLALQVSFSFFPVVLAVNLIANFRKVKRAALLSTEFIKKRS